MQCASCHNENPEGHKFCSQCGSPLKQVCGACNFANIAGSKFCGGCGASLGKAEEKPKTAEAERRQLTVMFCDLVGSTALSERIDPEDLRDAITSYQDIAAKAIERYGGYIARFMGDGLLIYFGYPNAHERDPERAVRAGLDIITAMKGRTATDGTALEVRIGAATGMVVAGDIIGSGASEERAVLGETPNLAARLQGLAKPGTMIISTSTKDLCGSALKSTSIGAHTLKGIAKPVTAYTADAFGNQRSAHLGAAAGLPLPGRSDIIDQFSDLWTQAIAGHGGVLLVSGEAGFGKTRLLTAFRDLAGNGKANEIVLVGSEFHQDSALRPFREYLLDALNDSRPKFSEDSWLSLETYLQDLAVDTAEFSPALGQLLEIAPTDAHPPSLLDGAAIREKTTNAFIKIAEANAEQPALLVIVEDAQWVDASSLEILGRIIAGARSQRQLIVIAARPEFDLSYVQNYSPAMCTLKRLTTDAAKEVINWTAGDTVLSQTQISDILEHADGVPLFLEEITKSVIDAHHNQGDHNASLSIPSTLQDSLMGRLDRLGSAKVVAQTAAVIGRVFRRVVLLAIANKQNSDLDSALLDLIAADLIIPTQSGPAGSFEFKQALIRDAAYQSLLIRTRRELHQSIAGELEHLFEGTLQNEPEIIAYHLTEAGLDERALPYWIKAAERAAERWANIEAVNFFQKALAAHRKAAPSETLQEIGLLLKMVASMRIIDRYDDAFTALGEAEALCPEGEVDENLIRVHSLRGNMYFPLGNFEGCLKEHTTASKMAHKLKRPDLEANALSGIGDAYCLKGEMARAEPKFDQAVEISRKNNLPEIETANLAMRGHMRLYLNQFQNAADDCRRATALALETGTRRVEMISQGSMQAKIFSEQGEWVEAERVLTNALKVARDLSALRYQPMYQSSLARVQWATGRIPEARQSAAEALSGARENGMIYTDAMVLAVNALVCDDEKKISEFLDEGLEVLKNDVPAHNHLWFHLDAMETGLKFGNWDKINLHADMLETFAKPKNIPWAVYHIERCRLLSKVGQEIATGGDFAKLHTLMLEAEARGQIPAMRSIQTVLPE